MNQWLNVLIFICFSLGFSLAWGRLLWFLDERAKWVHPFVFQCMNWSRYSFTEMKSMVLSICYYAIGLLAVLVFGFAYHIPFSLFFEWRWEWIPWIGLGIVAEVSLVQFLVYLYLTYLGDKQWNLFQEMQEIPWIQGIQRLPKSWILIAPTIGGCVEEFVFRGVFVVAIANHPFLSPWFAILWAGILFAIEQVIQLRTEIQVGMMLCSCIAISLVGGILVLGTGSVWPAALAHSSFVIFYFQIWMQHSARSLK